MIGAAADADEGMFDFAGGFELVDLGFDRVDRDREADADVAVATAAGGDLGVDADHLAGRVDQRPAGVAGVDRGVGLDHVGDREAVRSFDLALERRDDAAGDRAVEAEGIADRHHGVADLHLGGLAERQRVQLAFRRFDVKQGQVGGRVGADHLGVIAGFGVAEFDLDPIGAFDHVVVGQHVALGVDHEAGAGGGAAAFLFGFAEGREGFGLLSRHFRFDEADPVAVALVDLVDDVGVAFVAGAVDDRRRQRRRHGGRRTAFGLDPTGRDCDPAEGGDDRAAKQRGTERGAEEASCLAHYPTHDAGRH